MKRAFALSPWPERETRLISVSARLPPLYAGVGMSNGSEREERRELAPWLTTAAIGASARDKGPRSSDRSQWRA